MIVIRPATAADLDALRSLARDACARPVPTRAPDAVPMTSGDADPMRGGWVRVALDGDRLVGMLLVRPGPGHLLVEGIAVHPLRAGRGCGSQLLLHAEALAVTLGVPEIRLDAGEVTTGTLEFFLRRGYAQASPGSEDGVRPDRLTRWLVPPPGQPGIRTHVR